MAICVLICFLVLIRAFEDKLFYDPLLQFFKGDYKFLPLPQMDFSSLLWNVVFRFTLNSAISLIIIWISFKDSDILLLSIVLYGMLCLMLCAAFTYLVLTADESSGHLVLFYVRRFLIQPLLLLVLLPAFYFQKFKNH